MKSLMATLLLTLGTVSLSAAAIAQTTTPNDSPQAAPDRDTGNETVVPGSLPNASATQLQPAAGTVPGGATLEQRIQLFQKVGESIQFDRNQETVKDDRLNWTLTD